MFVMRHGTFTPRNISAAVTNSPAFQFGMKDVPRIRKEIETLFERLTVEYKHYKSKQPDDAASRASDIEVLGTHEEMKAHETMKEMKEQPVTVKMEMEADNGWDGDVVDFNGYDDHGSFTHDLEMEPSPQKSLNKKPSHKKPPHKKSSPKKRDQYCIFTGKIIPAGARIARRIRKKNAKDFRPKKKTRQMTPKELRDRERAQKTEKLFTDTTTKAEEDIGTAHALSVGVTFSQMSLYEEQKVPDEDGDYFCSQAALDQFRRTHNIESSQESDADSGDENMNEEK